MSGDVIATIAMMACFSCLVGGIALIRKRKDVRKGWLMIVMAAVLLFNVIVLTI